MASNVSRFDSALEGLKAKLVSEDNFNQIVHYFFDHLGEDPEFIKLCKPAKAPLLKEILAVVATKVFGAGAEATGLKILKHPKQDFYHGTCAIQGRMSTVLFFSDIDMGVVAIHMSFATSEISFVRFTSMMLGADKIANFTPSGSKTLQ